MSWLIEVPEKYLRTCKKIIGKENSLTLSQGISEGVVVMIVLCGNLGMSDNEYIGDG
jgi:hypothetical protein